MITLFILGLLLLGVNIVALAIKMTWGLAKAVICIIGLPVMLVILLIAGLVYLAVPLLIIAIVVSFIISKVNGK